MAVPLTQRSREPVQPVLNPNWRRVENLVPRELLGHVQGPDEDDDEWEEDEVEYVTLDFGPYLEAKALAEHDAIQMLAPESKTPMVLIGDRYFQGHHEPLVGTDILLLRDENASPAYKSFNTSSHRITFQPVALVPPSGSSHALGVPLGARGRGKLYRGPGGQARAASSPPPPASPAVEEPEVGPDGKVKRKVGRPKGSKNKQAHPFSISSVAGGPGPSEEDAVAPGARIVPKPPSGKGKERVEKEAEQAQGEEGNDEEEEEQEGDGEDPYDGEGSPMDDE